MGAKSTPQTPKGSKDVFKTSETDPDSATRCSPLLFAHKIQLLNLLRFADLVVMAGWPHPFPFRTRP